MCVGGTRTCSADGVDFGPCVGSILPGDESCAEPGDEDCDGVANEACACEPGVLSACYSGPPGTQGVGVCTSGTAICNVDGNSFGDCVGETLPGVENCYTPTDEDCDGASTPCPDTWSKRWGDAAHQHASDLAVDPLGNIVLTGNYFGTMDFGPGAFSLVLDATAFLAKLDPAGQGVCARGFAKDAGTISHGASIAVDAAGDILVVGNFLGTLNVGGQDLISVGNYDAFVARVDGSCNHVWSKSFGTPDADAAMAVAIDSQGNVLLAGQSDGNIDLGGGALAATGPDQLFVAKLDASGAHVWSKTFPAAGVQDRVGLSVDASAELVVVTTLEGTADYGTGQLSSGVDADVLVIKLDASGNVVYATSHGGGGPAAGRAVAIDSAGDTFVLGEFQGDIDLGGGPLTAPASLTDMFLLRLDATGAHVSSKSFGSPSHDRPFDVACAGQDVVLTGWVGDTVDFGNGPLVGPTGTTVFLVRLDAQLAAIWSGVYGEAGSEGHGVGIDSTSRVVVGGRFQQPVDFGFGPLTPTGGNDIFVAKLGP